MLCTLVRTWLAILWQAHLERNVERQRQPPTRHPFNTWDWPYELYEVTCGNPETSPIV
jgi:hypothetical protein